MDYMKEELERQRAALAGLLSGRGRPERETEEAGAAGAPGKAAPVRERIGAAAEDPAGLDGGAFPGGERAFSAWAGSGRLRAAGEAARRWAPPGEGRTAGRTVRRSAGEDGFAPGRSGRMAAEEWDAAPGPALAGAAEVRRVTEIVRRTEEGPERGTAERLSRLWERDARRYDGGFSLY